MMYSPIIPWYFSASNDTAESSGTEDFFLIFNCPYQLLSL